MIENEMMRVAELKLKVCNFIVVTLGCGALPFPFPFPLRARQTEERLGFHSHSHTYLFAPLADKLLKGI